MTMSNSICEHLTVWNELLEPKQLECEECVKVGGKWVHLRTCQTCGVTLCCDSSPSRHASRHFRESGHPIVVSAEPGERWAWCYKDEQMVGY